MTLSDRVKEILNVYQSSADISTNAATEAILQAFREVVPGKKKVQYPDTYDNGFEDGFNNCREEILDEIK